MKFLFIKKVFSSMVIKEATTPQNLFKIKYKCSMNHDNIIITILMSKIILVL
jgi:hypothetical protein